MAHHSLLGAGGGRYWGLSFTAEQAGSTVQFAVKSGTPPSVSVATSADEGKTWTPYTVGATITLAEVGDRVCFAAAGGVTQTAFATDKNNCYHFVMSGGISASGDISSMLKNDKATAKALTLGNYCYQSFFDSCTALISAPELPATSLGESCYRSMFYGCTALASAPELPATTLAQYCYYYMFCNCKALTSAPVLPATTLASYCYQYMFQGCNALASIPALPATTLANYCYQSMFKACTALTSAPVLPATTLANYCYQYMFQSCTSLEQVEVAFASGWGASGRTTGWLDNVKATGTFRCPSALGTDATILRGTQYCPSGWTVVNTD